MIQDQSKYAMELWILFFFFKTLSNIFILSEVFVIWIVSGYRSNQEGAQKKNYDQNQLST